MHGVVSILSARRYLATSGMIVALFLVACPVITGAADAPSPRSDDLAWLRRVTFWPDSATLARYRQLGRSRFLEEQLRDTDDTLPAPIAAMIDGYEAVNTPAERLAEDFAKRARAIKAMPAGDDKNAARKSLQQYRRRLIREAMQTEMLHAIYGGNQLKEQMVWFWLNHFSVYAPKAGVALFVADYEEHAIRPHALGKFKDLVMATLASPAMLIYLDNTRNAKGKTNENYARELMELHTLGVHGGYTQQDVQQLALILTGAGVLPPRGVGPRFGSRPGFVRKGLFVFDPDRHDFRDKTFLGHTIRGSGFGEIEQAVDIIVKQPACATFVSRRIAQYFVSDDPPEALIDAMAQTFRRTDGDIAAVLRTLFLSKDFAAGKERKFKDPMQFIVSAMRFVYDGKPIADAQPLAVWLTYMNEPIYGRITPDGWPLDGASWSGSGQMAKRFDIAGAIGSGRNRLSGGTAGTAPPPSPPALCTTSFAETLAPMLSASTLAALAKAASPAEWNTFLLSSPEFNYR